MIKLCTVAGRGERTRSLGPKRNPALPEPQMTMLVNKPESQVHHVCAGPCGPWVWTWSACLPPVIHGHGVEPSELGCEAWLSERLSLSASPFSLISFCGPFLPNRSKGERRIERERERPQTTMLALKWQIFIQRKVISSLEGRTLTDMEIEPN